MEIQQILANHPKIEALIDRLNTEENGIESAERLSAAVQKIANKKPNHMGLALLERQGFSNAILKNSDNPGYMDAVLQIIEDENRAMSVTTLIPYIVRHSDANELIKLAKMQLTELDVRAAKFVSTEGNEHSGEDLGLEQFHPRPSSATAYAAPVVALPAVKAGATLRVS